MTITSADVKLLASERMTDTTDGGGRRTANVIPDGVPGNLFPKVSRLDAVYGRVNLRKAYGAVQTATVDVYAGAHAVIMDAPDDTKIVMSMFSTASDFDTRTEARDRIESYVVAGPESRMTLFGRQLIGQGAFTAYQRPEEPLPEVGNVFCLSKEVGGVVSNQQYVRITDVTHEVRTFTDDQGDYTRRVVTLKISAPLRYEFAGQGTSRIGGGVHDYLVRTTTVADAARYYGIQKLTDAAASGDLSLKVQSVYSSIVPTTQRETPLSNVEISGANHLEPAGSVAVTYTFPTYVVADSNWHNLSLPHSVVAGSVTLTATPVGQPGVTYGFTDQGDGNMVNDFGLVTAGPATINYESGTITWRRSNGAFTDWTLVATFKVAAPVTQVAHTRGLDVTLATRGTVYVQTLLPLPAPGTTVVDYRALGKWYRLRDDGTGALGGDDVAFGAGTIDYVTGGLVVTLGALPDVGSMVMIGWASPAHYTKKAGATHDTGNVVRQKFTLDQIPVTPGSASFTYTAGSTDYTGTADATGVVTGGGLTGHINHTTGEVKLEFTTRLPNFGTGVTVAYQQDAPAGASPTTVSGTLNVTDPTSIALGTPVAAKGLNLKVRIIGSFVGGTLVVPVTDDGSGNVVTQDFIVSAETSTTKVVGGQVLGTIDYGTGDVSLTAQVGVQYQYWNWAGTFASTWTTQTKLYPYALTSWDFTATTGADVSAASKTFLADTINGPGLLYVDLTTTSLTTVVPGSVLFTLAGKMYLDRNGTLYTDLNANGSATEAGTIDYAAGEATVTLWVGNAALGINVHGCLTQYGNYTAVDAWFRTAGSPLRAESGYIQVTDEDGNLLAATTDDTGVIVSADARGHMNNEMGVVFIEWGHLVTAAGNESEPWYDPANVVGGQIWKPTAVLPGTIRYNGVVLSNLPLNADILGLDPVRLPSDGRVPIYRPADVAVIHNSKSTELPNPAVAGATYDSTRTDLADGWLVDSTGVRVATSKYVVDLAGGTVTMAADLDLTGIPQPLTFRHRIEQVNMLTDVQINGQLTLSTPLVRSFDNTDTYVSSAILFGDLFARVTNVFDQTSWDGTWADARRGSDATAAFDTVNYPIAVQNDGAVTERWRVNFLSSTTFQVIGEQLGVIATGDTTHNCVPVNSLTGNPYFSLDYHGWGSGWAVGNQLRFNTFGATAPIWIARTVLPGATLTGDSLDLQLRGDVDA